MRGRGDGGQKKHLLPLLCIGALVLVFLFMYYGSFFDSQELSTNTALEHGSKLSKSLSWSSDESGEDGKLEEFIFGQEHRDDNVIPKSYPVSELVVSVQLQCLYVL